MRGAALLALLVCGACAQEPRQPSAAPQHAHEPAAPVLLRYLPAERGGPHAYPEAQVSGVLDLSGACVRLQGHRGEMRMVISSPGPLVGRDFAGLYVQTAKERLRHGSSVTGGGGWFNDLPTLGPLDGPVPEGCRAGPFVIVTGMERYDPSELPPPQSPPPPPGG